MLHTACFPHSAWNEAAMQAALQAPGTHAWLWNAHEGFLMIRSDGQSADILTLGTLPAIRRQGIATHMLQAAAEACKALGVVRLVLEVSAKNTAACALYESLGYRMIGLRKGYYTGPAGAEDARMMELWLSRSVA